MLRILPRGIEHFSTDNRKWSWIALVMKTEQSESRKNVTSSQSDFRVHTGKLPEARENTSGQARLVLGLFSDWLRGWHECPEPITERNEAIPKKFSHSTKNCPPNWAEIFGIAGPKRRFQFWQLFSSLSENSDLMLMRKWDLGVSTSRRKQNSPWIVKAVPLFADRVFTVSHVMAAIGAAGMIRDCVQGVHRWPTLWKQSNNHTTWHPCEAT